MKQNIGNVDKIVRGIGALILAYLGYAVSPWFYIFAGMLLLTVFFGYCGLYSLLGIQTCPLKKK
ncbi:MAG: DUF2892 domain-containing protein [Candidatus Moraniibacteriota bacterium]|nr:MAG: DUF2892 domain-containing protein [Candidatus Moranbacteria bacterium]